jgi:hypothetical protein
VVGFSSLALSILLLDKVQSPRLFWIGGRVGSMVLFGGAMVVCILAI